MARILVFLLALGVMVAPAAGVAASESVKDDVVMRRDDDVTEVATLEDDSDDGDSNDGDSGTGDSNDGTGSGYSAVSRDQDRSRGDLTRDRTRDGAGDSKRDWTGGHTNDASRNDTR